MMMSIIYQAGTLEDPTMSETHLTAPTLQHASFDSPVTTRQTGHVGGTQL